MNATATRRRIRTRVRAGRVISLTANVASGGEVGDGKRGVAGTAPGAAGLKQRLSGLHRELFWKSKPIPGEVALAQMGLITGERE